MSHQVIRDQDVLYEDNHLIAIWKQPGTLVQGDQTGDEPLSESLKIYLREKYQKPGNVFAGVVHRIDRPVSGLVLLAKTSKGLARMNAVFSTREVKKTYWCVVEGLVERKSGKLEHFLVKDGKTNKSKPVAESHKEAKKAILEYNVLYYLDRYTLLEVLPLTGRHHQIRAQLAAMGHPIKGDLKYGAKRSNEDGSICLHARQFNFIHPVQNTPIEIVAEVPSGDIWKAVREAKERGFP